MPVKPSNWSSCARTFLITKRTFFQTCIVHTVTRAWRRQLTKCSMMQRTDTHPRKQKSSSFHQLLPVEIKRSQNALAVNGAWKLKDLTSTYIIIMWLGSEASIRGRKGRPPRSLRRIEFGATLPTAVDITWRQWMQSERRQSNSYLCNTPQHLDPRLSLHWPNNCISHAHCWRTFEIIHWNW